MMNYTILKNIKGLIFDCDGVLVDSEPLSCYSLNLLFKRKFNVDIGNDYSQVIGTSLKDTISYYFDKHGLNNSNIEELLAEKDQIYMEIAKNTLKPFSGIVSFLDEAEKSNYRIAVASSGSRDKINFNLEETKLLKYFEFITSSTEVLKGKPAPDLFLKAAEKFKFSPSECIVFEDSLTGIKAANQAGMYVVGITNTFDYGKLIKTEADLVIDSISEIIIDRTNLN